MSESKTAELAEIEETQAALRESIESAKELAEQAEGMLQKHKAALSQDSEPG